MEYINGSELAEKRFIKLENGDLREVQGKYVPEHGETYYCLNDNVIVEGENRSSRIDQWRLKHNLVFRTYEECEDYKRFLEVLDEYSFDPNWDDAKQKKWSISYAHGDKCIAYCYAHYIQYIGSCFESEEKAITFVKAVGEEAVKRYMFDVWE